MHSPTLSISQCARIDSHQIMEAYQDTYPPFPIESGFDWSDFSWSGFTSRYLLSALNSDSVLLKPSNKMVTDYSEFPCGPSTPYIHAGGRWQHS